MTNTAEQKPTLGDLLKDLEITKHEYKKANDYADNLNKKKAEIEDEIIKTMGSMGLTQIKNEYGTVSVQEAVFAQIEDLEEFYEHLIETKQPWLLQRRPNLTAYRELLAQGEAVPGLKPFTRKTLTVRK